MSQTLKHELESLIDTANAAISNANHLDELEQLRVQYLGKQGEITGMMKTLGQCSAEERPQMGKIINDAKQIITEALNAKREAMQVEKLQAQLASESIDVTLPGRGHRIGHLHVVSQTMERMSTLFQNAGFAVVMGREIEDEWHNFTALNTPKHHPARTDQDTFYFGNGALLRTQTSSAQIHTMQTQQPPMRIISPGKVYRRDSDCTHTPMFHQMEGLVVDQHCTFASLKQLLSDFVTAFFGREISLRFRASYFPFTEPSAEVDIQCVNCDGMGSDCRVCSGTGWLEVLGCGMVHPNVLKATGIDPHQYRGFAFGMGIERFAMLYYQIPDLRMFYENDMAFLSQF
ncbi:MAG: phenylalanine--tRNA ligase subunit alpha [Gammaproteobacteria bacterium RIFCSPHIGHO2_12_FULL_41_15]|nr:MAG: phenylalanine--tRNA ligase subunit alpha [Gammaproteobacteria bacterium RIFCSPHIGHO2_12_FULL_41_15]